MPKKRRETRIPPAAPVLLPGLEADAFLSVQGAGTAGVDEAGRGCLAGPVVAGAVILPENARIDGLDDSKKLSAGERETLAPVIRRTALAWGIGMISQKRIDRINILQATFEAMALAILSLARRAGAPRLPLFPGLVLVDGNRPVPDEVLSRIFRRPLPAGESFFRQRAVVGGDSLVPAISAASVLAKTWRDRLMTALDRRWPGYGFALHKGYGTRAHLAALAQYGPCPLHRLTFQGVLPDGEPKEKRTGRARQGRLLPDPPSGEEN